MVALSGPGKCTTTGCKCIQERVRGLQFTDEPQMWLPTIEFVPLGRSPAAPPSADQPPPMALLCAADAVFKGAAKLDRVRDVAVDPNARWDSWTFGDDAESFHRSNKRSGVRDGVPVNYRRGGDLGNRHHQEALRQLRRQQQPLVLIYQPNQHPWSKTRQDIPWWLRAFWLERERRVSYFVEELMTEQQIEQHVQLPRFL